MKLDTAVLYDIEYLIGTNRLLKGPIDLKVKEILKVIEPHLLGAIAVQKAYANWEDPFLSKLKREMLSLGIEPIQKITHVKNVPFYVAQLQLVLDAIELSHEKEIIKNILIVSGDNILINLNKRMAMTGVQLMSAAYKKDKEKINNVIDHEVIWLDNILHVGKSKKSVFVDPIVYNFKRNYKIIENDNMDYAIKLCKDILKYLTTTESVLDRLLSQGINISVISQLFENRIGNFNYFKFGFTGLVDFLIFLLNESNCKLVFKAPSEYRFTLKDNEIIGFVDYSKEIETRNIHTKDFYSVLLKKSKPYHRSFDKIRIHQVAKYLIDHKIDIAKLNLRQIILQISEKKAIEEKIIKDVFLTMIASNCFKIDNILAPIPEQFIQFEFETPREFFNCIFQSMQSKIEEKLNAINSDILEEVLI